MTLADITLATFMLFNSGRIVAYIPQIVCALRDCNGASAVSLTTWSLFAASNVSTAGYAATNAGDLAMAAVFVLNTVCCMLIVAITVWKRARYNRPTGTLPRA